MATSDAQRRAWEKWQEKIGEIKFRVPKEKKEQIQAHAASMGESVNAFIGLYLRLWLLMRLEKRALLAEDLKNFFGGMVAATGTLWEYKQHKGSYDHGFASFAALAIAFAEGAALDV